MGGWRGGGSLGAKHLNIRNKQQHLAPAVPFPPQTALAKLTLGGCKILTFEDIKWLLRCFNEAVIRHRSVIHHGSFDDNR